MIKKGKANAAFVEWQTDGLTAANANNAAIQGDDLANESRANTVRVGTYTQIMTKVVGSSTTAEAINKAGRKSELAREIMRSEEHTSELQSLMRISYAVFCLKKQTKKK